MRGDLACVRLTRRPSALACRAAGPTEPKLKPNSETETGTEGGGAVARLGLRGEGQAAESPAEPPKLRAKPSKKLNFLPRKRIWARLCWATSGGN